MYCCALRLPTTCERLDLVRRTKSSQDSLESRDHTPRNEHGSGEGLLVRLYYPLYVGPSMSFHDALGQALPDYHVWPLKKKSTRLIPPCLRLRRSRTKRPSRDTGRALVMALKLHDLGAILRLDIGVYIGALFFSFKKDTKL